MECIFKVNFIYTLRVDILRSDFEKRATGTNTPLDVFLGDMWVNVIPVLGCSGRGGAKILLGLQPKNPNIKQKQYCKKCDEDLNNNCFLKGREENAELPH